MHGFAVRLAVLMDAQPDPLRDAGQRHRNADLLREVLRLDEPRLRLQASRHAELPSDVDDVLQSAYLLFLERYNGCGEPLAWLYTTVKREAWGIRRRSSRRRERGFGSLVNGDAGDRNAAEAIPLDTPTPEQRVVRDEQVTERRRALAELKSDERRALWLLGFGLSYAEICQVTGWTYTKVNRCLSEGRVALRRAENG